MQKTIIIIRVNTTTDYKQTTEIDQADIDYSKVCRNTVGHVINIKPTEPDYIWSPNMWLRQHAPSHVQAVRSGQVLPSLVSKLKFVQKGELLTQGAEQEWAGPGVSQEVKRVEKQRKNNGSPDPYYHPCSKVNTRVVVGVNTAHGHSPGGWQWGLPGQSGSIGTQQWKGLSTERLRESWWLGCATKPCMDVGVNVEVERIERLTWHIGA